MLRTQAIQEFLKTSGNSHLTSLYNTNMEVQVNVARDEGEPISGLYMGKRWRGWRGPTGEVWKSFRIPWSADSIPQYTDRELNFSLSEHAEGIGMTGWDWQNRSSLWVGFDLDSIVNHKDGLSRDDLNTFMELVSPIPWVTLVKSTSGNGYHMYIHFDDPPIAETHTEHAAIARSLLGVLTMETGFNFESNVDVCGGVLWVYHRKQEGTDGLTLLKSGCKFPSSKIPVNWKDHVCVTAKKLRKIKSNQAGKGFEDLVASQPQIFLDTEHHKVLKWLTANAERDYWWDTDHNMLVCHTLDLLKCHSTLKLRGIFYTDSSGSSTQNCFAFPNLNGAWVVRRHGPGTTEHPSWVRDSSGWTRCVFNAPAELESSVKTNDGVKNIKGEYVFASHVSGIMALKQMDIPFENTFPDTPARLMRLKQKGDMLIVIIDKHAHEEQPKGFLEGAKGITWEMVIDLPKSKKEVNIPDQLIRHTISQGVESGWYVNTKGSWIEQNKSNIVSVLTSQEEFTRQEIDIIIGKCILSPWKIVNKPFADEYPGGRTWNKDCASLRVRPEEGICNTWLDIINHCGSYLNDSCAENRWCITNGVKTGGEYLLCWIAAMIQRPSQPLPYLFFVGDQNTGKSTLHEALGALIIKKGYIRADNSLTSTSGFNSELAGSVLCVVEETDLRKNKEAANRIKDWVTGKTISIRAMYKNAYDISNTTHWIQCANDNYHCVILPGDTRIVVIRVSKPKMEIPKEVLFSKLEVEAPAFLHLLNTIELPHPDGRLAIPCLTTHEKTVLEINNKSELEQFIEERCFLRNGHKILWEVFVNTFLEWLPSDSRGSWTSRKVSRYFPNISNICKGKHGSDNKTYVANLALTGVEPLNLIFKQNTYTGRIE